MKVQLVTAVGSDGGRASEVEAALRGSDDDASLAVLRSGPGRAVQAGVGDTAAPRVPRLVGADALSPEGVDDLTRLGENAHDRALRSNVRLELAANAWVRQGTRPGGCLIRVPG